MDSRAIAHARVEAKRLLKHAQTPSFVVPTRLSQAQDVIAVLKGFPHWHALQASGTTARVAPPESPLRSEASPGTVMGQARRIDHSCWVYAKPGAGKSVFMALHLLDLCQRSLDALPRAGVIDIGPSSNGLVDTLQHRLPPSRHHEVMRLRVGDGPVINPFDTPLGVARPQGRDRRAKLRWLNAVLTLSQASPTATATSLRLAETLIHQLYDAAAPVRNGQVNPQARRYQRDVDPTLDTFLQALPTSTAPISWWDVVQTCLLLDQPILARRAQRHAVPTLKDLAAALDRLATTTPALDTRPWQEALGHLTGSWLDGVTTVEWDQARVVALDLDRVSRVGPGIAERLAGVHHLGARVVIGQQPGLVDPDELDAVDWAWPTVPVVLPEWHRAQWGAAPQSWLLLDEWHRVDRTPDVHDQLLDDLSAPHRRVMLLTQSLDVLTRPNQDGRRTLDRFGQGCLLDLTPREADRLRNRLDDGPQGPWTSLLTELAGYAPGFRPLRHQVTVTQHAGRWHGQLDDRPRLPPTLLWALSTTSEDVLVRERLIQRLGWAVSLRWLAQVFPSGSCRQALWASRDANVPTSPESPDGPTVILALVDRVWRAATAEEPSCLPMTW